MELTGKATIDVEGPSGNVRIDFSAPFVRLDIMTELQKHLGQAVPDPNKEESVPELLRLCKNFSIPVTKPYTPARLMDQLIRHLVEPECIQPTFILHHPLSMSPLAKECSDRV